MWLVIFYMETHAFYMNYSHFPRLVKSWARESALPSEEQAQNWEPGSDWALGLDLEKWWAPWLGAALKPQESSVVALGVALSPVEEVHGGGAALGPLEQHLT